jgi:hypothetical protein
MSRGRWLVGLVLVAGCIAAIGSAPALGAARLSQVAARACLGTKGTEPPAFVPATAYPAAEDPIGPIDVSLSHPETFQLHQSCVGEWNRYTTAIADLSAASASGITITATIPASFAADVSVRIGAEPDDGPLAGFKYMIAATCTKAGSTYTCVLDPSYVFERNILVVAIYFRPHAVAAPARVGLSIQATTGIGAAGSTYESPAIAVAGKTHIPVPGDMQWFSGDSRRHGLIWGESAEWGWTSRANTLWTGVTSSQDPAIRHAMVFADRKTLVASPRVVSRTTFTPPLRSGDGGRTWVPGTPPAEDDYVFAGSPRTGSYVAPDPTRPDIGWYCDGGLFETIDRGVSWDGPSTLRVAPPWTCAGVDVQPGTGNVLVLLRRTDGAVRIVRSTNHGATWHGVSSPAKAIASTTNLEFAFDPTRPSTVLLTAPAKGTRSTLYRSTTGGTRWAPVTLPDGLGSAAVEQYAFARGRAVALLVDRTGRMRAVQSTDHGATWTDIAPPLRDYEELAGRPFVGSGAYLLLGWPRRGIIVQHAGRWVAVVQ